MTPVGHSITGAALGVLLAPAHFSRRARVGLVAACVVAASAPDLPFPGWGHDRYDVSHSLFVNALLALVLTGVLLWRLPPERRRAAAPALVALVLAWLSHLLLDSFYANGRGIDILWPFATGNLALPIPVFDTLGGVPPPLDLRTLRICAIESVCYLPLFLAALWARRRLCFRPVSG